MPPMPRALLKLLLIESVLIVGLAELAVMLALELLPWALPPATEAMLDVLLLLALSAPLLAWRLRERLAQAPASPSASWHPHARIRGLTAAIFIVGAAASLLAAWASWRVAEREGQQLFEQRSQQLQSAMRTHFDRAERALRGIAGLRAATGSLDRAAFQAYWVARDFTQDFPGIRGFGYIERVEAGQLAAYLARQRRDYGPGFALLHPAAAAPHYVISHIEPLARNQAALGLDLAGEPLRAAAARAAARSGRPVLTSVIQLVQDERQSPGFLLLLPVYAGGRTPATVAEREARHLGFAYAPIVAAEALADLPALAARELRFTLYAEGPDGAEMPIYPLAAQPPAGAGGHFRRVIGFTIAERPFRLVVHSTPVFDNAVFQNRSTVLGAGGVLLSALLALIFWLLASARARAEALARTYAAGQAAALRETEALMNTINTHAIISETTPDGRIVRVNEAFCRISGYSAEELIGQDHRIVNSGLHDRAFWQDFWRTIASGRPWRGQIRNRAKDGRFYWLDSLVAPFMDAQGRIEKYVSIRFDITRAHQAEEELARERQRLQTTLDGTGIGTWEVHVRTGENRIDARWAAMLGYTLDELMPMTPQKWRTLTHPDDEPQAQARLLDYLHGRSRYFETERRLRHKDGHWVWVLSRGAATSRTPAGEVEWMAGTHLDVSERHALQEQLEQRNALLGAILENLPSGLSAFDGELNLTLHNRRFRELLDFPDALFTPEPVPFERIIRYNAERGEYGPGDPAALTAAIVERARHPVPHQVERTRPDGRVLDIRGAPLPGGGFVTTYTDITEQRQAEREARQADEMLRQAIDALDEAFVIYDEHDRLLLCNQRYRDIYPLSAPKMVPGVSFEELIRYGAEHGEYAEAIGRVDAWVAEQLAQHRRADTDLVQPLADGRYLRIIERRTPSGHIVGFRIDVTDLVRARQATDLATQASEEALARLRAIYDVLPVGLTITDPYGQIIDCNPASERLLGISREEHLARRADGPQWTILREDGSLMPPEEYPSVIALKEQRPVYGKLMQLITPQRALWLRVSAVPMPLQGLGVVVAYVDVTEGLLQQQALREAMQRAEEASRAKSQFLANMSHEIRTPMNAILGMLSLLQGTELNPRQLDYVSKTEAAARSLLGLLNDILDFSKVEAGKMTLESAPLDLEALLRDLSVILAANTGSKPLEVLFDIDARLPPVVLGDALRLKQVLINLGGNAIKFTERGTVVLRITVIELGREHVELEFAVQDSGIGIAPENLQRIFQGFTQAEASTTRRFGGTGLGLAISARLVALMGGQLQVQSTLGQGSLFYFRLRLPLPAQPQAAPATPAAELAGLHVLVIDDNPITRQVLLAQARALRWQAEAAASGDEALALIEARLQAGTRPFDAVFVDWQMPGLDGWQTSLEIRRRLGDAHAPILVMVTAHGREQLAQRPAAEQALLNGFLVKPVTAAMLREAVAEARLGGRAARAAPKPGAATRRLLGLRLLLVEDNPVNQQVAQELLQREGAAVTVVGDGQQGVQALAQSPQGWDLVLMDVQMPVMDGYTATREIRQRLGLRELPIIAMTANAMESDRQQALDTGMNDHIGKPFVLDELVRTILTHSRRAPDTDEESAAASTPASPLASAPALPAATAQLDLAAAAQRLGADVAVLRQVLHTYARDLPQQLQQLHELLAAGRYPEATRLLHTMKGSSATVGASELAALAAQGEARLRNNPAPDAAQMQAHAQRLQLAAQALLPDLQAALAALEPAPAPGAGEAAPLDEAALRRDLDELLTLLRQGDLASLDVFARIQQQHGAALGAALQELDQAMAGLELEQAAALCETLRQRYTGGDTPAPP